MLMPRARRHGNEHCPVILRCLLLDADSMQSAHPVMEGASVVRWSARAPPLAEMHTRQWVGTYAGRGNGDYRGELTSALQAITTYLKHFAFPPEVALVRLDGQYGDAAVIAQLIVAGVYLVTRGRGYPFTRRFLRKEGEEPNPRALVKRLIFAAMIEQKTRAIRAGEKSCLSRVHYRNGWN